MASNTIEKSRTALIALLQKAYANEQAAAHAYQGHSLGLFLKSEERAHIRGIARAEWRHYETARRMLEQLRAPLPKTRGVCMALLGRGIGVFCVFGGKLIPMYGAGWLESDVVNIYEQAARHAFQANHQELIPELLDMAEEEWDHEAYFMQHIQQHPVGKHLKLWNTPAPRASLRTRFSRFCMAERKRNLGQDLARVQSTR